MLPDWQFFKHQRRNKRAVEKTNANDVSTTTIHAENMEQVARLIHFNVNSIVSPAKKVQLIEYINRYNPEIVFLTETKLKPGHFFAVKNYNLFRADRLQTNGGGTAILVENTINAKQVKSHSRFFESCVIKLKLSNQSVMCIAIYVPPTFK